MINKTYTTSKKSSSFQLASKRARIKAFIIDIFMIYVPMIYFLAYVVAGSKDTFNNNWIYPFITWMMFCLITSSFLAIKAQTPGYKYTNLYIIDIKNKKKPGFFLILIRFIAFCVSYALFFGIIFVLFRNISFHDFITNTRVLQKQGEKQ